MRERIRIRDPEEHPEQPEQEVRQTAKMETHVLLPLLEQEAGKFLSIAVIAEKTGLSVSKVIPQLRELDALLPLPKLPFILESQLENGIALIPAAQKRKVSMFEPHKQLDEESMHSRVLAILQKITPGEFISKKRADIVQSLLEQNGIFQTLPDLKGNHEISTPSFFQLMQKLMAASPINDMFIEMYVRNKTRSFGRIIIANTTGEQEAFGD